jgi:large subunit ribosomal protein L9
MAEFEARRAELEKVAADKLAAAQGVADKMAGLSVSVARKAGMDGRLFGSVGNADIADALKAAGFDVDKAAIRMPEGPLKAIGEFPLDVALHTDVLANITVAVVAE